jgi:hypothetical protein
MCCPKSRGIPNFRNPRTGFCSTATLMATVPPLLDVGNEPAAQPTCLRSVCGVWFMLRLGTSIHRANAAFDSSLHQTQPSHLEENMLATHLPTWSSAATSTAKRCPVPAWRSLPSRRKPRQQQRRRQLRGLSSPTDKSRPVSHRSVALAVSHHPAHGGSRAVSNKNHQPHLACPTQHQPKLELDE